MRYTTYRYNSETCQYERVKVRVSAVLWYSLCITLTAGCMLIGILILHDLVVNTQIEKGLRKENRALKEHYKILTGHLNELEPVLTSLQNKDHVLHLKIFGSEPVMPQQNTTAISKQKVLLADPASFRNIVAEIKNTSAELLAASSRSNVFFDYKFSVDQQKVDAILSLPARQPFHSWESDMLISGFGLRVNPFHKGLYEHVGIDIAMPRGTNVVATASGVIIELKRSELQAGYGNYVDIDHGNGMITRYAHLEQTVAAYGQKIKKGDIIGTVGTSGGSVAPHLHYEVLRDGKNVDPINYIIEGLTSDQHDHLTMMSHQQNQSLD